MLRQAARALHAARLRARLISEDRGSGEELAELLQRTLVQRPANAPAAPLTTRREALSLYRAARPPAGACVHTT